MRIPTLETDRLVIREFVPDDLDMAIRLLQGDRDVAASVAEERAQWLQWTVLNYEQLAQLHQPPYGDRAIVSRETGGVIGACGYVPQLAPFAKIPGFVAGNDGGGAFALNSPEVGLYWAVLPEQQRRGYATEAAQALVRFGFDVLHLYRIVATTDYDNLASIAVMQKLGMRIERNPTPDPEWLQIVGILSSAPLDGKAA
jgi:RimJ/RimL family protein N-acetyltransferase